VTHTAVAAIRPATPVKPLESSSPPRTKAIATALVPLHVPWNTAGTKMLPDRSRSHA